MGEWKTEILDKLCTHIQSGGTPKSDHSEYYNGEIPFVAIEDITSSNKYLLKTKKHISEKGLKNSAAWLVPANSLMYSIYATLGSTLISKIDAATNQAVLNLIVNTEKVDIEYLYYFLTSLKNQIYKYSAQTTQSNLNAAIVKAFVVKYPESKSEQTRIAEILSTADEAIAHTESLIAKYQRLKIGLMQDLLTKGIDENGNIRSKETHKFVIKNGIEVPEEWEVKTFNQLCSIIKDGTHLPPKRVTDGIWLLGVTNIIVGEWKITKSDTQISEDFYNQMHKNWQIEIGDVLLAIVGATIGKVTQVPADFPKFTLQRSVCLLRGKNKELSNDFLRLFIESLYFQSLLWNEVNVTAQPGIYLDTIGKFLIRKPQFEEQLMIVDRLSSIKETIDNLLANLNKLHSLKTGLMQDLLSGKVRVNIE